jgi:guanine deaminase
MDERFLREAIALAVQNAEYGGGPFGALVVKDGVVVASAVNSVTRLNDPTAHAEILAIRKASEVLGSFDLSGCTLYSSCEPCPMCLGAVYWAHLDEVVYACNREDAMEAGFDDSFIYDEMNNNPGSRKLLMSQSLRGEGLKAFKKWETNPDKKVY